MKTTKTKKRSTFVNAVEDRMSSNQLDRQSQDKSLQVTRDTEESTDELVATVE